MDIFFPDWLSLLVINKIYQSTWLLATYRLIKLVLRLTTNTTELSRLCSAAAKGAMRMAEAMEREGDNREKYAFAEESEPKPGTVMVRGFEVQVPVDLVFRIGMLENQWVGFGWSACFMLRSARCIHSSVPPFFAYPTDRSILYSKQLMVCLLTGTLPCIRHIRLSTSLSFPSPYYFLSY